MDQFVHSKDLRDKLDLNEDSFELKRTLQMYLPPVATAKTRGIDCMIALIRCIYSHMTPKYWERNAENIEREKKNPLLALAWLDVDYEHLASIAEWGQARQEVAALFGLSESTDSLSFETILESDLMAETLWKEPEFVLWTAMMMTKPGKDKRSVACDQSGIPRLIVDRNRNPNLTFRDFVRKPFSYKLKHGTTYVRMSAEPRFIRVDYSTKPGLAALPFSTIKNIKIPIVELNDSAKECWYTLFAVVSLQETRSGPTRLWARDRT
ncbi:uncharacterized protein FTOL_01656 [Fusarium torulosum]|uniref:Uncharacterized protein n=1 Tax=Fusarium torulosum TaxID=33205 RepID=A0AAE8M0V1_9HYPO|nr:uncharacterized protein FTOL_01656 [Fusarium torulosum]